MLQVCMVTWRAELLQCCCNPSTAGAFGISSMHHTPNTAANKSLYALWECWPASAHLVNLALGCTPQHPRHQICFVTQGDHQPVITPSSLQLRLTAASPLKRSDTASPIPRMLWVARAAKAFLTTCLQVHQVHPQCSPAEVRAGREQIVMIDHATYHRCGRRDIGIGCEREHCSLSAQWA